MQEMGNPDQVIARAKLVGQYVSRLKGNPFGQAKCRMVCSAKGRVVGRS